MPPNSHVLKLNRKHPHSLFVCKQGKNLSSINKIVCGISLAKEKNI